MSEQTTLLTESQVSERTGFSERTLQSWRYRGTPEGVELPYVKIGGAVRYRACDVEALIDANLRRSTSHAEKLGGRRE